MNEFVYWVKQALSRWKDFGGRARRREYWYFALAMGIGNIAVSVIDQALGTGGVVSLLYLLAALVPSLSVAVRRLHDTNKPAWWLLAYLVPIVGMFLILYFCVLDSQPGTNKYGHNPKGNDGQQPGQQFGQQQFGQQQFGQPGQQQFGQQQGEQHHYGQQQFSQQPPHLQQTLTPPPPPPPPPAQ